MPSRSFGVNYVLKIADRGYVADWDVFFEQLLPVTAQVPYMVR